MFCNNHKGFTLIEILIVISIIAIMAAVVIIAINPARQFAQVRNVQRQSNTKAISDAINQYIIDNKGNFPEGIDDNLRMIGTVNSGCDVSCGELIAMENNKKLGVLNSNNRKKENFLSFVSDVLNYSIPQAKATSTLEIINKTEKPTIISAEVEPNKVLIGDIVLVRVEVEDVYGIESITANMGGIETIGLKLKEGNIYQGFWEAQWKVYGTKKEQYITTVTVTNKLNISSQKQILWSDPSGWVSPTGYEDPGNQWSNESKAYDGNTGTYAQNGYGNSGWGQFIVLTLLNPITSDRLRVNADYLDAHITEVDIDVFKNGVWEDVFQGGNEGSWNCKWVEIPFAKGSVTKARFRYNYKVGGYYYWLYEFQFYETTEVVNPPACGTQDASSTEENFAILHGTIIDDGGEPCDYRFQYGKTLTYGNNTAWRSSKISNDRFSELIGGLEKNIEYHFRTQIRNSTGTVSGSDKKFITKPAATAWVSLTGYSDPDNKWENEPSVYDDDITSLTRDYHNIGDSQWSSFIYLNRPEILSDRIRFYARGGDEVNSIDIDIMKDGVWENLYEGSFPDKQWVEETFSQGMVNQARVRFYTNYPSYGFYWELYEFDFWKIYYETSASGCSNLTSALVPKYLSAMPFDPLFGSPERTYYAIKLTPEGRLMVKSCKAELEEKIYITR